MLVASDAKKSEAKNSGYVIASEKRCSRQDCKIDSVSIHVLH